MKDTTNASEEITMAIQPRTLLLAFWRRLTSISARRASPVPGRQPDMCSASSSSVFKRSSAAVAVGLDDIEDFLSYVNERHQNTYLGKNNEQYRKRALDSMTDEAYIMVIDVPDMMLTIKSLADQLKEAKQKITELEHKKTNPYDVTPTIKGSFGGTSYRKKE